MAGSSTNTFTRNRAQANSGWDAEDENRLGANYWLNNVFGTANHPWLSSGVPKVERN